MYSSLERYQLSRINYTEISYHFLKMEKSEVIWGNDLPEIFRINF